MMKIKFRAWDEEKEHMVDDIVYIDFKAQQVGCHKTGYGSYMQSFYNIALLPYIGIKDKNGTEIYSGDIVRYSFDKRPEHALPGNYLIEFGTTSFVGVNNKRKELIFNLWFQYEGKKYLEVIGNRWENPELLEGKE